jgi:bifunctional enzyme CysN/CysC/sulfate adenylyltransferase subunit 1
MIVWMHAEPLETTRTYLIKHCARQVRGRVTKIRHRVNIDTLEPDAAERLLVNDIASVEMETSSPLFFDSYQQGKLTGAFIVIDALTNATLGAGMIEQNLVEEKEIPTNRKTRGPGVLVAPLERHQRHRHYPAIILIKGHEQLGSKVERALFDAGFEVMLVREENASFTFARSARASLYAAGFIVVYQTSSIGAEETRELKAIAGDWFFDLAGADLPLTDFETVEQILAFAETLRISNVNENPWEAV